MLKFNPKTAGRQLGELAANYRMMQVQLQVLKIQLVDGALVVPEEERPVALREVDDLLLEYKAVAFEIGEVRRLRESSFNRLAMRIRSSGARIMQAIEDIQKKYPEAFPNQTPAEEQEPATTAAA